MDFTSKRMFDLFKDQIWKELGPLDPNWFESLTAEGLAGSSSDQDELCANQEALSKTLETLETLETRALSQMCSTPKLFKHPPTPSLQPDTDSFSETLPWPKGSPCVLQTETSQLVDLIAVLHSPKRTDGELHPGPNNMSFAKHISERLGAIVGDISWTSSLNTPPPERSTLILSRKNSSSTVTLSEEKHELQRELFPSNSSASVDGTVPGSQDQTALLFPDAELNRSPQAPVKDEPVPSVTEDVHNEVKTENTTSCTISSSILRKVRHSRVTRRLIPPLNDNSCSAKVSEDKSTEPSSGNTGFSQWSPLSLSEIQTHSEVNRTRPDSGAKETNQDGALEAESKKFPASEQDQASSVDDIIDKTLQRSQLSLTNVTQTSNLVPLPHGFSPAACLSALKRVKRRTKRGSIYQNCEVTQDPESNVKQSSVHDSGIFSVAETALLSSTERSLFKVDSSAAATDVKKEDICETVCQSAKGNESNISDMVSFNENINVSPVSLKRTEDFSSNIEENKNASRDSRSDSSNDDVRLTVSQKADVKELCALLEQHSSSQFDFTQPAIGNINRDSQNDQCPLKSLQSDLDAVNTGTNGTINQRQNMLLKVEPALDETRRSIETGDQTGNHFEGVDLNTCQGFKTAGGKGIRVSAKSLLKSHDLFKDCDNVDVHEIGKVCDYKSESGFKNVPVENQETATFRKPSLNVVKANENPKPVGTEGTPLSGPRRGFKRPHDTRPVSAKRAKLSLPDFEGERNTNLYCTPASNSLQTNKTEGTGFMNETLPSGFSTAGGKRVHLSQKDFEKVKHIWKDFDDGLKTTNLNGTSTFESTAGSKASQQDFEGRPCETKPLQHEHNIRSGRSAQKSGGRGASSPAVTKTNEPWTGPVDSYDTAHLKLPTDSAPGTRGFLSAKGKALRISAQALMKAKAMFEDISSASGNQDASEMPKARIEESAEDYTAQRPETVKVCSNRSSSLFRSELSAKPESRFQNQDPEKCPLGVGFTTASGKKVAVSEEAINSAKRLLTEGTESRNDLQDISLNTTIQRAGPQCKKGSSINKNSSTAPVSPAQPDLKPILHNPDCSGSGFTTASGKKVGVSEEALNVAKKMLTEGIESGNGLQDMAQNNTIPANEPKHKKANSSSVNLDDAPASHVSCAKTSRSGFSTASGKKVSISEEALNKAMIFLTENDGQDNDVPKKKKDIGQPLGHSVANLKNTSSISCVINSNSGFSTASGKKVTVSEEALNKAMNFLTDKDDQDSDANVHVKKEIKDCLSSPIGPAITQLKNRGSNISCLKTSKSGFSTASGKKVTISEEALNKALHFLTEKEEQESDLNAPKKKDLSLPFGHSITKLEDAPISTDSNISCIKNSRGGFSTASGKKVSVSEEALSKAMILLTEKAEQCSDANVEVKKENKDDTSLTLGHSISNLVHAPASNISCIKTSRSGFSTASGKKVTVSEEALNKAMNFLTEEGNQESFTNVQVKKKNKDGSVLPIGHALTSLDNTSSEMSSAKTSRSGFSTASGKKVTISEEALNKAMNLLTEEADVERESSPQVASVSTSIQKDAVPLLEYKKHKGPGRSGQGCPVVNLDVPDLSDCTTTQQKFLAQEALDCTRALLEDEDRAAQSLEHGTTSTTAGSSSGKRRREDETDLPQLGRKSPEDVDGALDRRKESILNPMKSCINVLSKDRRVFQYHVPLHPNITKSDRFGKDFVNMQKPTTAVPSPIVKSGQADFKAPLFVPPFLNTRAKAFKDNAVAQKEKPSTFVPPFKKLKSEGSSFKTQHKDGSFVKESPKTATFIPPTRKSQNEQRRETDAFPDKTNGRSPQSEVSSQTQEALETRSPKGKEQKVNVKETKTEETRRPEETGKILLNPENLDLARDVQDMRIRKKSRQTIRPMPGSLFLTKSSLKRSSFRTVVDGQTPRKYCQKQLYTFGVDQAVCQISSETAEEFCFDLLKFYKHESFSEAGGVQLADGGWLVPRRDGTVGKEDFYRALCDSPGVDPKLLTQSWVYNHYRWLVWKLASMERSFPSTMASVCLTPEQVLLQLKYRYDVEVDHSRRPCLRKIMERDDTCAKTLVLCVCGVEGGVRPEVGGAVLWVTDGWYTIRAQLDEPLTALLHRGAIAEGVKLMTHGAQLLGPQEPCAPLEAPHSLLLKIFANSTRRVRWDTKLGFYKDPRPFVLPLSSVFSAGGAVSCVDMLVLRVYPLQWMERKADGGVVFRSERAEEKEARSYNNRKQKTLEAVYAKIKAEFEKEEKERVKSQGRRRSVRREDLSKCQDGEELFEAVGDETDVEACLTPEQLQSLSVYRRALLDQRQVRLQERLRRAVDEAEATEGSCPKRDLSTVWRLCITDYRDQASPAVYQLSIWNPSSDLQAALKEGSRYEASNLTASEGRKQSGRAAVQLTSTRKTHFRNLQASAERLLAHFQPRVAVTFAELQSPGLEALCGEVDLAGSVLSITDQHGPSPSFYLVDGRLDVVKVHSLASFSRCGWDDLLQPRVLLCLSNLQVRAGGTGPTPVLYAGDMSALSSHPREGHLRQALGRLQQDIQEQEDFFVRAEKRLFEMLSFNGVSAANPRTPQSTKTGPDLSTSVGNRQAAAFTPTARTPVAPNTPQSLPKKDPKSLKRRRALDYLCQLAPPPPLSPLSSGSSPSVKKTFLPPRRSFVTPPPAPGKRGHAPEEEGWVHDDELALIDTQELRAADALLD